ncbi:MAG: fimbria/pilus outer membrane usher protein [Pseudomonadota bacterium]
MPFIYEDYAFGDVLIEFVDEENFSVDAKGLAAELSAILNEEGRAALANARGGSDFLTKDALEAAGFSFVFDLQRLQIEMVRLNPQYRELQFLGGDQLGRLSSQIDIEPPAKFSTYLNLTTNFDYLTEGNIQNYDVFFDGAARWGDIVFEYEGGATSQFSDNYRLVRRSARLVYDQPDKMRRFTAGDLTTNTITVLRNAQIGGFAVEKSSQLFGVLNTVSRLDGQVLFLDNRSTVDVLVDGNLLSSTQLDAGPFDISTLPIQQGSNNIQLRIRDSFGREEFVDYNFFFQQLPIAPGQEEYSLAVGFLAEDIGFEPIYGSDVGASGFYRRALSTDLLLGGALQASQDTQVLGLSMIGVPQVVPGVFDIEAAVSNSDVGSGFAARGSYSLTFGEILSSTRVSLNFDFETAEYRTIDNLIEGSFDLFNVGGSVSRSFGPDLNATAGLTYISGGGRDEPNFSFFADLNYRLNDRLRITAGGEFGRTLINDTGFGVRVGISYAFGGRTRANADYRSQIDSFRANISRGSNNRVGSFGYDVSYSRFGENNQGAAQVDYVSNRFEVRGDVQTVGDSFSGLLDQQRYRLQVGTSLAYAKGAFGIGRPVSNSFIVAKPADELGERSIITGRDLSEGRYYARSGTFGAAVQGDISPFTTQSVQFDSADPDTPFDVGDGITEITPPYKSGYRLDVGNTYSISFIGTLADPSGPVSLATGRVVSNDGDEDFAELPFFTNAKGRFGLYGLAPGRSYLIDLNDDERSFVIEIEPDSELVVRASTLTIPSADK